MNFSNQLKMLMSQKNIGVTELASKAQVSPGHLSRIMNGKSSTPKPDYIIKLSKALDIPATLLLDSAGYQVNTQKTFQNKVFDLEEFLSKNSISYRSQILSQKDIYKLLSIANILFERE